MAALDQAIQDIDRPQLAEQRPIARSEPVTPPDLTVLI